MLAKLLAERDRCYALLGVFCVFAFAFTGATREHTYQTGRTWGRGSLLLLFFDCGTKRFWGLGSAFDGRLVFLRALLFVLSVVEGRGVSALRFGRQERAHGGI